MDIGDDVVAGARGACVQNGDAGEPLATPADNMLLGPAIDQVLRSSLLFNMLIR